MLLGGARPRVGSKSFYRLFQLALLVPDILVDLLDTDTVLLSQAEEANPAEIRFEFGFDIELRE